MFLNWLNCVPSNSGHTWKESVVARLKTLSYHLLQGLKTITYKTQNTQSLQLDSKSGPSKYEAGLLTIYINARNGMWKWKRKEMAQHCIVRQTLQLPTMNIRASQTKLMPPLHEAHNMRQDMVLRKTAKKSRSSKPWWHKNCITCPPLPMKGCSLRNHDLHAVPPDL